MDAHALLSKQGWRGHGHSLHHKDDSIGLAKPILFSRKDNTKGLGVSQHFNPDQWWLNAFDEQLKGIETDSKGRVQQTVTTGKLDTIAPGSLGKYSVYTSFVSGGLLEGTVDLIEKASNPEPSSTTTTTSSSSSSDDDAKPAKSRSRKSKETRGRKERKKDRKESKDERRARKEAKRIRKAERATRKAERRARKEAKALRKGSSSSESGDEEKRRRRERKEAKRRKRRLEGTSGE